MLTRRTTTALTALALAGLLGACGDNVSTDAGPASIDESASDGDGDGGGGSTGGSNQDRQDAVLEYAQCMRDNGVDMPDPEVTSDGGIGIVVGDGSGGPRSMPGADEDFQAADAECHHIIEDVMGERPQLDPEDLAERQDQLVEMAECMRGKGHDMPDPQLDDSGRVQINVDGGSGGGGSGGGGSGPGSLDEETQSDMEDCRDEVGMEAPEGGMQAGGGR